jgi:putative adhesin
MRIATRLSLVLACTLAPVLRAQQPADAGRTFHWSGPVAATHWLRVRNLSGAIHVERSTSGQVEVDAEKRGDRGDPGRIRFVAQRTGADSGDMLICALWDQESRCDVDGYQSHSHHHGWNDDNDDVSVRFTVKLPAGVNIGVSTVNGAVSVDGATAEVDARTVNGGVEASTLGGPVNASTVNGDVEVHMADIGHATDLEYSTVNGSVTLTLPTKLDATVELSTVNGSVQSDYPLSLEGRIDPKHLHGTIGAGGLRIHARTVNGHIDLRKT